MSNPRPKLVMIGNGMAGMRAVEEILSRDADAFDISVYGAEPAVNYNRIMLSPVLAGEKRFDEIILNDRDWYDRNGVTLHAGVRVATIDRNAKCVVPADGQPEAYDRLIIATGSEPFVIPVPGRDLDGVRTFRDMDDVNAMLEATNRYRNAVVIGGGLLGLEAASGLRQRGMTVTVVHLMDVLMERQLDEAAGFLLKRELEGRGITVLTGANTKELLGNGRVGAVRLEDGREIPAELVVMAAGIRPSTALARDAGLEVERGIVVDDHLRTSDPHISAVGECVQHRGQTYGLVAPLFEMGKVLADQLTGHADTVYEGSVANTKLKVSGVDVFSLGDFAGGGDTEDIVFRDAARGVYKRVVLQDDRVRGAVLYGDTADGAWYVQLLKDGTDISSYRDTLIFGRACTEGRPRDPRAAVADLADEAEICGCNGVCKGEIVSAIAAKGLSSVQEVRTHTKASSSCGSCTGLVEQLLSLTLGGDYAPAEVQSMCGCTGHGHDDVRRLIVAKGLTSIPEVMQELEWTTATGCPSCRPALNYYLLCANPGTYRDDAQSRFINERAHANIQKNGTYSVVPRMWGGLTNAAELRAIADVVDKFAIPTVKVTGGQRIDLLGVRKEDLPAVWADLSQAGLVSGHAYGKAVRTVKTCVGQEWCRFGTQRSMDMGVQIEKLCWGSWTPHKVKMAVSGCPRNCAEATIKDFGVVAVDSGWELHVGGNGGITVRVTDLLCKVETQEEVLEYCGAFLQLYREHARYLERTAPWVERVGLEFVKARIVEDADSRRALFTRFLESQEHAQTDPWRQRAEDDVDAHEFTPLAVVA